MPGKKERREPTDAHIEESGKGNMDDEMLPARGTPVDQEQTGGNEYDTAGEHGDMAPGTAKPIKDKERKEQR